MNLMALVPWGQLILWQVVFVVVGGLLGWWRGRTMAGVVAALILGPFGWVVPFLPRRTPPSTARVEKTLTCPHVTMTAMRICL